MQTLNFPAGLGSFTDSHGTAWTPNTQGQISVDPTVVDITEFLAVGFTQVSIVAAVGVTASRPTNPNPGDMFFDTSLNSGSGLPIWRNAANTGWINAAGTSV